MIAFGPVPSRRLGRSLGINNIPPKICSYACVYCQLGRTIKMQVERQAFYEPEAVFQAVQDKVERARAAGEIIDYLTFVPDGEPTLDANLGRTIELLKPLGIKIAVISNASLIWHQDVRDDLMLTDWVSLKIDSIWETVWRKIDRPHGSLQLTAVLDGALEFARSYQGKLVTETMLVHGVNDDEDHLWEVADFLARLQPATAYLAIPTRPPAENWVQPPAEETIARAYHIFRERLSQAEYLIGYEGNAFAFTGNVEEDLLSIMAVHPMRENAVCEFLRRAGADWAVIDDLLAQHRLLATAYEGERFYMLKLHGDWGERVSVE
ncbi:MAG: radical SAM protein [Chloroflexota bacterium]|nr:radical SAM protein [Chloroflexota bacterium]